VEEQGAEGQGPPARISLSRVSPCSWCFQAGPLVPPLPGLFPKSGRSTLHDQLSLIRPAQTCPGPAGTYGTWPAQHCE
jgi:hypothetical protein